jgi:hypothetical protein
MPGTQLEAKSFFAGLFDFGFTSFVTLKFLRVIYTILVVAICLMGVVFLIAGFAQGGISAFLALILAPLMTLLYLVFARIWMETIALFFRIGENTSVMAAALTQQQAPPPSGAYAMPGQ